MMATPLDWIARMFEYTGKVVLAFMALTIAYDALMRYAFAAPTSWSLEVNSFLLVYVAIMVAADVERRNEHIGISLLQDKAPRFLRRLMQVFIGLVGAGFCGILAWRGFLMSRDAFEYGERVSSALGTPMWIPYALLPIGFTSLGAQFLLSALRGKAEKEDPAEQLDPLG